MGNLTQADKDRPQKKLPLTAKLVVASLGVNELGNYALPLALPLLILESGGSASDAGMVLAMRSLASVLSLILGGVIADRVTRTKAIIAADLTCCVATLFIAIAGGAEILLISLLVLLVGFAEGVYYPALNAIIPDIVDRDSLQYLNSVKSVLSQTAGLTGPLLAGVVVTFASARVVFVIDAVTFLLSTLCVLFALRKGMRVRPVRESAPVEESFFSQVTGGFAYIWRRTWIKRVIILDMVYLGCLFGPITVILPVLLRENDAPVIGYTTIVAAFGIGSIAAGIALRNVRLSQPGLLSIVLGKLPPCVFVVALLAGAPMWLLVLLYILTGFGAETLMIFWNTALHKSVPPHLMGRVTGADWSASTALVPLGIAAAGFAVEAWNATVVFTAGIGLVLITALWAASSGDVRRLEPLQETQDRQHR